MRPGETLGLILNADKIVTKGLPPEPAGFDSFELVY